MNPHLAHKIALNLLRFPFPFPKVKDPIEVFGLNFPNRVGLGAGWDKNGVALRGLQSLGFGHVEVGTVTLKPQTGIKNPILIKEPTGIINRLGLPSDGIDIVAQRIRRFKKSNPKMIVGVSLSKNNATSDADAAQEIEEAFLRVKDCADYITLNISCPNVRPSPYGIPALKRIREQGLPILVKLSCDSSGEIIRRYTDGGASGFIATNSLYTPIGAVSGERLRKYSQQMLQKILVCSHLPIISSGGIILERDAANRIHNQGAALTQLWSGFVLRGPLFPYHTAREIKEHRIEPTLRENRTPRPLSVKQYRGD